MTVSTGQLSETVTGNSSDDEVEIKEETAEVVEISSEDEKPNVQELEDRIAASQKEREKGTDNLSNSTKTVTKKVNDLIITVPQTNTSRKIKLKRNSNPNTRNIKKNVEKDEVVNETSHTPVVVESNKRGSKKNQTEGSTLEAKLSDAVSKNKENRFNRTVEIIIKELPTNTKDRGKNKDEKKKKKRDKKQDEEGSDHDEITLQLSDTEKLDLLEGLEGKTFEMLSDTEDSSEDFDSEDKKVLKSSKDLVSNKENNRINISSTEGTEKARETQKVIEKVKQIVQHLTSDLEKTDSNSKAFVSHINANVVLEEQLLSYVEPKIKENNGVLILDKNSTESTETSNVIEKTDIPLKVCDVDQAKHIDENAQIIENIKKHKETIGQEIKMKQVVEEGENIKERNNKIIEAKTVDLLQSNVKHAETDNEILKQSNYGLISQADINITDKEANIENNRKKDKDGGEGPYKGKFNDKSEGELSDRDSSEVEESELKAEVVCISDYEDKREKKKKKEKKSKKCKKSKDFRWNADQNFYAESINEEKTTQSGDLQVTSEASQEQRRERVDDSQKNLLISIDKNNTDNFKQTVKDIADRSEIMSNTDFDDNVYEILELSDDSSCYEVDEISISKEPTAEEIKALSAKIDEIERDRSIDTNEVGRHKVADREEKLDNGDIDGVSWKDRYLKSAKVLKVLSTANILNAMRKKNLDLKKKLQDSKIESKINKEEVVEPEIHIISLDEGSIQHYNTLEASTKYVDPVKEPEVTESLTENVSTNKDETQNNVSTVTNKENITDKKDKAVEDTVTNEMKKEAKQLLKMYKMLLKYNDVTKQTDTTKKSKKKKKSKEKDKGVAS